MNKNKYLHQGDLELLKDAYEVQNYYCLLLKRRVSKEAGTYEKSKYYQDMLEVISSTDELCSHVKNLRKMGLLQPEP